MSTLLSWPCVSSLRITVSRSCSRLRHLLHHRHHLRRGHRPVAVIEAEASVVAGKARETGEPFSISL
ncbi:MAG: hypothetical protein R3C97_18215 [Geminicoccaceae bacterium]